MKTITKLDEFNQIINEEPYTIFIFGSLPTCHPCRKLHKWIETEYPSEDNIYEIDILDPEFETISNDIDCFPTIILYHFTEVQKKVEGFTILEIKNLINKLNEKRESDVSSKPNITVL